jgi:alcohol dehydrogenase
MTAPHLNAFDFHPRTRLVFGVGALDRLGEIAADLGFRRTLLVADEGLRAAGHVDEAAHILAAGRVEAIPFHGFGPNPDSAMVESGRAFAAAHQVDSIVGLGGGSSMDCAKGINFVLTNGGRMQDYWGYGKAARPLLPMIGIPTTAGTGSEAQSFALISDSETHVKMACGDPKAAFKVAILDPRLTISQPAEVRAMAGYDAISHAVETYVTTRRNAISDCFAREAWRLLESNYERVMSLGSDLAALGGMQLGAWFAGMAIDNSMLGATHACANPLTARYGTPHGIAIAALLPYVVCWNASAVSARYGDLLAVSRQHCGAGSAAEALAIRLDELARAGGLPTRLPELGVARQDLPELAEEAAKQWTGQFNPRPFDRNAALEVYQCAY